MRRSTFVTRKLDTTLERPHPWQKDHPVLLELRRRRDEGSRPGDRTETGKRVKIGLAVEGGGMRGVVSAAMLSALEDLGMIPAFDAVYGCSSGAINGAYFLAKETWYPLSIYYDDLTTNEFADFRRLFSRRSILNLDYVFNDIMEKRKPLDYERVLSSDIPLGVAITFVDEQVTKLVRDFTSREDLKSALIASSWLPVAVRGTATFRGKRAVDGGVLAAHPFKLAVSDGCTHILSLSTRPMRVPSSKYSATQLLAAYQLERAKPGLGEKYKEEVQQYRLDRIALQRAMTRPTPNPYILDLAPLPDSRQVGRHEKDYSHLVQGARSAYELMYCAIEDKPVSLAAHRPHRAIPRFTIVNAE